MTAPDTNAAKAMRLMATVRTVRLDSACLTNETMSAVLTRWVKTPRLECCKGRPAGRLVAANEEDGMRHRLPTLRRARSYVGIGGKQASACKQRRVRRGASCAARTA